MRSDLDVVELMILIFAFLKEELLRYESAGETVALSVGTQGFFFPIRFSFPSTTGKWNYSRL